jgi:septal ring factor EnvC (AmiA/AmiB activator)
VLGGESLSDGAQKSLRQASATAQASLASSSQSAQTDLADALAESARLSDQVESLSTVARALKLKEKELAKTVQEKTKLAGQIDKLEKSVEDWKGKAVQAQAELQAVLSQDQAKGVSTVSGIWLTNVV